MCMQELVASGCSTRDKIAGAMSLAGILAKYKPTSDVIRHAMACVLGGSHV